MRAGELRNRLTLQKPTYSRSGINPEPTWGDVATVWGGFLSQSGRLVYEARQNDSQVQGIARIRYRSDICAEWRLKYGSRILTILSIVNVKEQDRELLIHYRENLD